MQVNDDGYTRYVHVTYANGTIENGNIIFIKAGEKVNRTAKAFKTLYLTGDNFIIIIHDNADVSDAVEKILKYQEKNLNNSIEGFSIAQWGLNALVGFGILSVAVPGVCMCCKKCKGQTIEHVRLIDNLGDAPNLVE